MQHRRLHHELANLRDQKVHNDEYMIDYDDEDITKIHVVIKAPLDSLYRYRFVRLSLQIPQNYPFSPPQVQYFNYAGTHRTHPNLYQRGGKVCLSILGTWDGEPWTPIMTLDLVFRTIQSLLDYTPYVHEPGQRDNKPYNIFISHVTWKDMLMDYVKFEQRPILKEYMIHNICLNESNIRHEIANFPEENVLLQRIPYRNSEREFLDWKSLKTELVQFLDQHNKNKQG